MPSILEAVRTVKDPFPPRPRPDDDGDDRADGPTEADREEAYRYCRRLDEIERRRVEDERQDELWQYPEAWFGPLEIATVKPFVENVHFEIGEADALRLNGGRLPADDTEALVRFGSRRWWLARVVRTDAAGRTTPVWSLRVASPGAAGPDRREN